MSNKVTYAEIIEALSRKTGFSKNKSEAFTKALIDEVKEELQETGKATITNFGSFEVKEVAERQGQNPQTGEPITIPAHKRVNFTPYKALREEVNAKYAHLESELIGEEKAKQDAESEDVSEMPEENEQPESDSETEDIIEEQPRSFDRRERARGKNTGVIMLLLLVLVIIGLASAWFLMGPDEQEQTVADTPAQTEQESNVQEQPEAEAPADDTEQAVEDGMTTDEEATPETEPTETAEETPSGTNINGNIYQVKENEWYWVIAEKVYEKSQFWPLIFQENRTVEDDPDQLYPSSGLEVPDLTGTAESPTKGDYQRLSEASMMVSEAYRNAGKPGKADDYALFAEWCARLGR